MSPRWLSMRALAPIAIAALSATTQAGCNRRATGIHVEVLSNIPELRYVQIVLRVPDWDAGTLAEEYRPYRGGPNGRETFNIYPRQPNTPPVLVEVLGFTQNPPHGGDTPLVVSRALVRYTQDEVRVLTIRLDANCSGVDSCSTRETCSPATGTCVSNEVQGELPRYGEDAPTSELDATMPGPDVPVASDGGTDTPLIGTVVCARTPARLYEASAGFYPNRIAVGTPASLTDGMRNDPLPVAWLSSNATNFEVHTTARAVRDDRPIHPTWAGLNSLLHTGPGQDVGLTTAAIAGGYGVIWAPSNQNARFVYRGPTMVSGSTPVQVPPADSFELVGSLDVGGPYLQATYDAMGGRLLVCRDANAGAGSTSQVFCAAYAWTPDSADPPMRLGTFRIPRASRTLAAGTTTDGELRLLVRHSDFYARSYAISMTGDAGAGFEVRLFSTESLSGESVDAAWFSGRSNPTLGPGWQFAWAQSMTTAPLFYAHHRETSQRNEYEPAFGADNIPLPPDSGSVFNSTRLATSAVEQPAGVTLAWGTAEGQIYQVFVPRAGGAPPPPIRVIAEATRPTSPSVGLVMSNSTNSWNRTFLAYIDSHNGRVMLEATDWFFPTGSICR